MEGENKSEKKKRYCMEDGVLIKTVYLSRLVLATEPQEITPFRSMGLEKRKLLRELRLQFFCQRFLYVLL